MIGTAIRALVFVVATLVALPAAAQDQGSALPCGLGMVERSAPPAATLQRAGFRPADAAAAKMKITFVGHATFLLESPDGATLATDWNGFNLPPITPDIVTMNNFHITHYSNAPDPAIKHVLRGWDPLGGIARHHMKLKDLRVYSVPTNIQSFGARATNGNSIFVFEAAGVCVAHLSHLHHDLTEEEAQKLGRIDVLIVPVDGYVTMSHAEVMHIIEVLKPRLVLPCHWDLFGGPFAFHRLVQGVYPTKTSTTNAIEVSQDTLPQRTEVLFLRQGL
jgi:L-ascorbate metabolism protein UlaG (beta-lactamase superfamily)